MDLSISNMFTVDVTFGENINPVVVPETNFLTTQDGDHIDTELSQSIILEEPTF